MSLGRQGNDRSCRIYGMRFHFWRRRWNLKAGLTENASVFTRFRLLLLAIEILVAMSAFGESSTGFIPSQKRVLILNSYHKGFPWTDEQTASIRETLSSQMPHLEFFIEYMDTKRVNTESYLQSLRQLYRLKYDGTKLDLIASTDDDALLFLLRFRDEAFGRVPVVFCGVNDFHPEDLEKADGYTGIVQSIDALATVELIERLHPRTKTIYLVSDGTTSGVGQRKEAAEELASKTSIRLVYLNGEDLTFEDLLDRLKAIPKDAAVLQASWIRDKQGVFYPADLGAGLISSHSPVPVYGLTDMYLGFGIVGGKLNSCRIQGRQAGEMALRILAGGESADTIPILPKGINPYLFDYRQLKRWGIDPRDLPRDSILVNRPFSPFVQYRSLIYGAAVLVVFLCAFIALQHFHIQRRKRVEEALRRSETRYRELFDNARDLICSFDPEGRLTAVNHAFREVLGYEPDDLVGTRFGSIIPEEYREQIREKMRLKLEGQTDITRHEIEVFAKDGRRVPIEVVSRGIREDGAVVGIQAIGRDVTDRWLAEVALRKSEERFRKMVEDSAIPIAINTYDGHTVYFNHKFMEIFGYTVEDIPDIERWWALAYPDEDYRREVQAVWTDAIREADRTGREMAPQEWRVTCKDGSVRDVEFKYTPMADQWVVVFHDVTERREAERALRENERMLATLMRNLPGMAYRCKNDSDWTMVFVSEGCLALCGYSSEDLLDNYKVSYADLIYPDDRHLVWSSVQQGVSGFVPYQMEYRIVAKSGEVKWVWEQGCGVYDTHGLLLALEGFIADITERRRAQEESRKLEAQVLQAQKLESMGILAGGIAHDFNNLLMAILGNADLALTDLSPVSPARDSIREIETASRKAADLCRQMLAYSGKGRFVVKAVNLNDLVQEMAHLLHISISKMAVLKFNFDKNLPSIHADATQMRQVVMNLLTNSSEAIGDRSGVIAISTGHRRCVPADFAASYLKEELPEGDYVYLEVADTGCGMDEDTLKRLFDPFFTTKFQGRGLGMAAVLGIVRGHCGAIAVKSEPGRGTTFTIWFPAVKEAGDSEGVSSGAPQEWRGQGTVLIVDDEETLRRVGQRMLERFGFEVVTAEDGEQALELFRQSPDRFVCVILDLTMPRMDGEEAHRRMKEIRGDVPVILSSGYNEQEVISRFVGQGLAGFIQKPYQAGDLMEKIREILSRSKN